MGDSAATAAHDANEATATAQPGAEAVPGASELKDMFPELDEAVIRATLEAHGGNVEASVSSLLGMTDPNAKPGSDTAGDEALARQMALETEQIDVLPPAPTAGAPASVPYRPYVRGSKPRQATQYQAVQGQTVAPNATATGSGRDELQKLQDDFQRLAGVGKKTVSGWLSTARAKYQDMQQPRPETQADPGLMAAAPAPAPPRPSPGGPQVGSAGNDPRRSSSRITQPLPHGSRYDAPSTAPAPARDPAPASTPSAPVPATTQASTGGAARDEDAEDLEFVRNPFEDED